MLQTLLKSIAKSLKTSKIVYIYIYIYACARGGWTTAARTSSKTFKNDTFFEDFRQDAIAAPASTPPPRARIYMI